jgi:hypothetical protein
MEDDGNPAWEDIEFSVDDHHMMEERWRQDDIENGDLIENEETGEVEQDDFIEYGKGLGLRHIMVCGSILMARTVISVNTSPGDEGNWFPHMEEDMEEGQAIVSKKMQAG